MPDDDFEYDLPADLIAQDPPSRRADSRLLVTERGAGVRCVHRFEALADLLRPGDLLVVNDSRVMPARLWVRKAGHGGRVELLLLHPANEPAGAWFALARPVRRLRPGTVLNLDGPAGVQSRHEAVEIVACLTDGEVLVRSCDGEDLALTASRHGDVPLPPYIRRDPGAPDAARRRERDRERYQTVYARTDREGAGSVAAPTAGMHFDPGLLELLGSRGVVTAGLTLHIGAGTFRQPSAIQIASGRLHAERFSLPSATWAAVAACRARGARLIAVGTTSLRVLETVHRLGLPAAAVPGTRLERRRMPSDAAHPVFEGVALRASDGWRVEGLTRLFIQPPDRVRAADGLLTNFHLPGSSLLRLVAAFTGTEAWRAAYREAVRRRFRFYSYGDAMLILPPGEQQP